MQVQQDLKNETEVRNATTASAAAAKVKKRRNSPEGLDREFPATKVNNMGGGEEQNYYRAGPRACPPTSSGSRDYHYVSDHHFRSGSSSSRQSRNRYDFLAIFLRGNQKHFSICFFAVAATAPITTRLMWPTPRRHLPPEDQGAVGATANTTI